MMGLLIEKLRARSHWDGECRVWDGARIPDGYGHVRYCGKAVLVHRLAWELFRGQIQLGLDVLHACDNPPCWRIEHLFLGTHMDNMRDMIRKGRWHPHKGSRNGRAKLTEKTVLMIRKRYAVCGITRQEKQELADGLGLDVSQINRVIAGKTWRHVV